jgi:predicted transcriptional regulator
MVATKDIQTPTEKKRKPYTSVLLEPETRKKIEKIARANDLTLTQVIRRAVREYLEKIKAA